MSERKRTVEQERELNRLMLELYDLERWNRDRHVRARNMPDAWSRIAYDLPCKPKKQRVTIRLDEDLLKFFRGMGLGYQTRINAVLRAYMLGIKSKEILGPDDFDWKGDEIWGCKKTGSGPA